MRAGRLRHRITIQQKSSTVDAAGQEVDTWEDLVARLPARVMYVRGGESPRGLQVEATTTHVIETRPCKQAIDSCMRAVWCGRIFNITSAGDPEGDGRRLLIESIEETS